MLCNDSYSYDKGTPVERQGRKATGLRVEPMTAGLPTETWMLATNLRNTGRYRSPNQSEPAHLRPRSLSDLKRYLTPNSSVLLPIRPQGSGTASTDCNRVTSGSTIHMRGVDRIIAKYDY